MPGVTAADCDPKTGNIGNILLGLCTPLAARQKALPGPERLTSFVPLMCDFPGARSFEAKWKVATAATPQPEPAA